MVDTFLELAKKERDRLKEELLKSPIYLRLKWVEDFIESNGSPSTLKINGDDGAPIYKNQREKIEGYSLECIRLKGNKATMHQIHEHLEKKGIKIKQITLSSYLSVGKERMRTTYNGQTKEWSVS